MMKTAANFILYQIIWAICVIKENEMLWLAAILLIAHLAVTSNRAADLKMMGFMLMAGACIDGSLNLIGFFSFNVPSFPIPPWLCFLWLGLATLPHNSLSWMKNKPVLCSLFGAFGGPLAYWAGVRLDAARFALPTFESVIILAFVWSILWPITMNIAEKILPSSKLAEHTKTAGN